jgi:hypothetical protein
MRLIAIPVTTIHVSVPKQVLPQFSQRPNMRGDGAALDNERTGTMQATYNKNT